LPFGTLALEDSFGFTLYLNKEPLPNPSVLYHASNGGPRFYLQYQLPEHDSHEVAISFTHTLPRPGKTNRERDQHLNFIDKTCSASWGLQYTVGPEWTDEQFLKWAGGPLPDQQFRSIYILDVRDEPDRAYAFRKNGLRGLFKLKHNEFAQTAIVDFQIRMPSFHVPCSVSAQGAD
jgi:hypothetical protein